MASTSPLLDRIGTWPTRLWAPSMSASPNQARPSSARLGPRSAARPTRDGSDDARTVPSGPRISARLAPDSATARSTSGASVLRGERIARNARARSVSTPCSRRRRSSAGRGRRGTPGWTAPPTPRRPRPARPRRPPAGTPGTGRRGCVRAARRRRRPCPRDVLNDQYFLCVHISDLSHFRGPVLLSITIK